MVRNSHTAARLGRLLAALIATPVLAVAGCEAGTNAPTQEWHQPTDGAGILHDNIAIRNVFVLGAPIGVTLKAGGSAGLFLALINNGSPDTLLRIFAPGTARSVTLPGGAVRLGTQQAVLLTGPAPKVILQDLTRPLTGGSTVRLVLIFRNAASASLTVPVMPKAQYYATFSAPPSPTPTVTKHRPRAGASATPGATPTPTSSP